MAQSNAWKDLERWFSKLLNKYELEAFRKTRGTDWGKSDFDVEIVNNPEFKFDCKHSKKRWKTSSMLEEVKSKYCKQTMKVGLDTHGGDIPVLICKNHGEHGAKITVDAEMFVMLLSFYLRNKNAG